MPLTPEAVSVELQPLMLWMANTTELLSFVQEKVLEMEKEADQEGELGPQARAHASPLPVSAPGDRDSGLAASASPSHSYACPQTHSSAMTWNYVMRPWPFWMRSSCVPSSSLSTTSPRLVLTCFLSGIAALPVWTLSHGSDATSYETQQDCLLL